MIMPNHVHAIVALIDDQSEKNENRNGLRPFPTSIPPPNKPKKHSVSQIIGSFKSFSTRGINQYCGQSGVSIWQTSYYDHIIRNEADLNNHRQYIENNPARWQDDMENPIRRKS